MTANDADASRGPTGVIAVALIALAAALPLAWWAARWPFQDLYAAYAFIVSAYGLTTGVIGTWVLMRRRGRRAKNGVVALIAVASVVAIFLSMATLLWVYAIDERICGEDGPVACGGDGG